MHTERDTNQPEEQDKINRREFLKKSGKRLFKWGPIASVSGATVAISASLEGQKLAEKNQKINFKEALLLGEAILGLIAFWTGMAMSEIGINRMYPPNDKE